MEHYARLRENVEREVGRHQRRVRPGRRAGGALPAPVVQREELAALYRAADVMAVTPLRDGMNLVAKEYVAARTDLGGALVLSEFAGAARELRQAYLCNPHDLDSIKDALLRAVEADRDEAAGACTSMRRHLRDHGVAPVGGGLPDRARGRAQAEHGQTAASGATSTHATDLDDWSLRAAVEPHRPDARTCWSPATTTAPWRRIVDDPTKAAPLPEAVARSARWPRCRRPRWRSISGRSLRDLAALSRLPSEVHLVGSHGSEFDVGFVERIAPELGELRTRLGQAICELAAATAGRPARAEAGQRRRAHPRAPTRRRRRGRVEAVRSGPGDLARRARDHRQGGHRAVRGRHRQGHGGRRAAHPALGQRGLFLGDDVTDENAFANLQGPDVGIKIGPATRPRPATAVDDPRDGRPGAGPADRSPGGAGCSASTRCRSSATRCSATADTLALLTPAAKVAWLCHPRPDSPAVFARPARRRLGRLLLRRAGRAARASAAARAALPRTAR